jgi:predicted dehydrogenase
MLMKILAIGGGSIARRHLGNLRGLGVTDLAFVEPDDERREEAAEITGATGFVDMNAGADWKPDVAWICSPNHLHVEHARYFAERGCHLFIEKPLSHTMDGLDDLAVIVKERGLVSLVGCNMRFHPGPTKVKEVLDSGAIGRVLFSRVHTGSYLPGWRPWQDYRQSYSARPEMGGGCILDCIHEIDLARWYCGEVTQVFCEARTTGAIEIDTEDYAMMLFRHADGVRSEVHLDYVSRTYERGCHIAGECGSIFWDYEKGVVEHYDAESDTRTPYPHPEDYDVNSMYLDETRHFLECVKSGAKTVLPVDDAVRVMRVALSAKLSASRGTFVNPEDVG